jgi:serine protease
LATTFALSLGANVAMADKPAGEAFVVLRPRDAHGGGPPVRGGSTNLTSHGGSVQTATQVYMSFWGPEWGITSGPAGHTNQDAQDYIKGFFGNVGGSDWINTDTQYCQNVPNGTSNCANVSSAQYIGNLPGQLAGAYIDPTPVPSRPTQQDIAAAAARARSHFGNPDASQSTFMVFTPSGKSMNGFKTNWCAWHSSSGSISYAYIPYMPDAGASCGMNFVNPTGYFDGFSIVAGHEYEEAQTDPYPNSGWLDRNGAENADKCAWSSLSGNISLGGTNYAVQPLWSNRNNGCVLSSPPV